MQKDLSRFHLRNAHCLLILICLFFGVCLNFYIVKTYWEYQIDIENNIDLFFSQTWVWIVFLVLPTTHSTQEGRAPPLIPKYDCNQQQQKTLSKHKTHAPQVALLIY